MYRREVDNTERGEPAIIIAADTIIVSHKGRILEKPRGEVDHINMLKMLRDEVEHKVMTAVVVMRPLETAVDPGYKMETHVEETTVKFDPNGMDESIKCAGRQDTGKLTAHSHGRSHSCLCTDARW